MAFLNETGTVGLAVLGLTNNVTGSSLVTYLFIFLCIVALCFAFRIPLEYSAFLVLPLTFTFSAVEGGFLIFYGAILIYITFIIVKNFYGGVLK